MTDFLDEVCHLFQYDEDGPELDKYIYLWGLTEDDQFCKTLTKLINIEILYTGDEEMEIERNGKFFALLPEFTRYNRDSVLDYDICPDDFDDFAYAFRNYLEGWITEFQDYGNVVKDLHRRGDLLDVIIS